MLLSGDSPGDVILVYNGTELEVTDADPKLLPYQLYQYMVIAVNGAGKANSPWAEITTKQAPPTLVNPPVIVVSCVFVCVCVRGGGGGIWDEERG